MSKGIIKTDGIITRSIKYRETSLILDVYTRELGMRRFIINGVRKKNSRVGTGVVQLMSLVSLVCYFNPDKEIHRIQDIEIEYPYKQIFLDQHRSLTGLFALEVIQKAIHEPEANADLYAFLYTFFRHLDETHDTLRNLPNYFLLQLSTYLGIQLFGDYSEQTPWLDIESGTYVAAEPNHIYNAAPLSAAYVSQLQSNDLSNQHEVPASKEQRKKVFQLLLGHYAYHLERFGKLRSVDILAQLFEK